MLSLCGNSFKTVGKTLHIRKYLNLSFRELPGLFYSTKQKCVEAVLQALPRHGMRKTQVRAQNITSHFFNKAQDKIVKQENSEVKDRSRVTVPS